MLTEDLQGRSALKYALGVLCLGQKLLKRQKCFQIISCRLSVAGFYSGGFAAISVYAALRIELTALCVLNTLPLYQAGSPRYRLFRVVSRAPLTGLVFKPEKSGLMF